MDYEELQRIPFDDGVKVHGDDYVRPWQDPITVRSDGGQVVWYVPEVPYVVLVPAVNRPTDITACRVYGPYGWLEAGHVADRLGGIARSVSSDGVIGVQPPVSDSGDQVRFRDVQAPGSG